MNGSNILADTNILIYLLKGNTEIAEVLNGRNVFISFITEMELLAFPDIKPEEEALIEKLVSDLRIINLNEEIKKHAVELRRQTGIKLPDAIIGASALYYNLPLLTGDNAFSRIEQIELVKYEV